MGNKKWGIALFKHIAMVSKKTAQRNPFTGLGSVVICKHISLAKLYIVQDTLCYFAVGELWLQR